MKIMISTKEIIEKLKEDYQTDKVTSSGEWFTIVDPENKQEETK